MLAAQLPGFPRRDRGQSTVSLQTTEHHENKQEKRVPEWGQNLRDARLWNPPMAQVEEKVCGTRLDLATSASHLPGLRLA